LILIPPNEKLADTGFAVARARGQNFQRLWPVC
jgi:hypothetical protein